MRLGANVRPSRLRRRWTPTAWRLAADVASRMRASADAVRFMRRAVELAPGDAALLVQLGQYLLSMGLRADALATAAEAEAAPIDRPSLLDALGVLC